MSGQWTQVEQIVWYILVLLNFYKCLNPTFSRVEQTVLYRLVLLILQMSQSHFLHTKQALGGQVSIWNEVIKSEDVLKQQKEFSF